MTDPEVLRRAVRERYGSLGVPLPVISNAARGGCCGGSVGCCGGEAEAACCTPEEAAESMGYSPEDLRDLPPGANLGLGCGNPAGLLALHDGETVLDLGSGGGVDCFIASKRVGPAGRVIGVDTTPEMVARARRNAAHGAYRNVDFRLGEIEHLPVADRSVDVVLSNCVINLVPDKLQVYREAFRVLRPGGRLSVADVVATRPIPEEVRATPSRWSSCSSGALTVSEIEPMLRSVGFDSVIVELPESDGKLPTLAAQDDLGVVPGAIRALRPLDS